MVAAIYCLSPALTSDLILVLILGPWVPHCFLAQSPDANLSGVAVIVRDLRRFAGETDPVSRRTSNCMQAGSRRKALRIAKRLSSSLVSGSAVSAVPATVSTEMAA